jgi:hypothetical protein
MVKGDDKKPDRAAWDRKRDRYERQKRYEEAMIAADEVTAAEHGAPPIRPKSFSAAYKEANERTGGAMHMMPIEFMAVLLLAALVIAGVISIFH